MPRAWHTHAPEMRSAGAQERDGGVASGQPWRSTFWNPARSGRRPGVEATTRPESIERSSTPDNAARRFGYRALADASFEYGPLPAELTAATL